MTTARASGYRHNVCLRPGEVSPDTGVSVFFTFENIRLRASAGERDRQLVKRLQAQERGES